MLKFLAMDNSLREEINAKLPGLLKQAHATRAVNRMVKTKGKRIDILLNGRHNEAVLYCCNDRNAPLIIGFHSGGWLFGGCALNDNMWSAMTENININIISVGYRMAPEYKWRDSLSDAYESAIYLTAHADEYGLHPSDISIAGLSAGGNMAAAICIKALSENLMSFKSLFLFYPLLDVATMPRVKGSEHYGGISAFIMNEQHIEPEDAHLSLASPYFAADDELKGFPDTYVFAAEHDVLKHEALSFAQHINNTGGFAEYHEMKDMSHCYFELGFRDRLTDFEKEFIGPQGIKAFENGSMKKAAYENIEYMKRIFEK